TNLDRPPLNFPLSFIVSLSVKMFNHTRRVYMKLSSYVVIALFLFAASAMAQDKTPVVNQRERNQQHRIRQGVKSGELTKGEARRLERQEGKIKADEMIAKSDGKVTKAERRKLNREQNRESKRSHRAKHNKRVRKA